MGVPAAPSTRRLQSNEPCWCGSGRKYKRCHRDADTAAPDGLSGPISPGHVGPGRTVPPEISRPPYADTGHPGARVPSGPKTAEQIERMRRAGQAAADVLQTTGAAVAPGVTTDELDAICHAACIERGAYPSPLNYQGFPKSLCTSVNEVICHGIPDDRPLANGDIVNLDVTTYLDGVHGDTNATFLVGDVPAPFVRLVQVTEECMWRGIEAVRPGRPVHDIGRAIEAHARAHGYGVVRQFVGHGIGETFHAEPSIPHYYDPSAATIMEPGLTFTIEPMITMGTWRAVMWDDGWTALTADGSRTAQFEHTILVTDDGAEVLTLPS
jgi:methionyl aminopeptidase